jgi:hypothetical protein
MNLELQATSPTLTSIVGEISFFLCRWANGAWRRLTLVEEADGWAADEVGFSARLRFIPQGDGRWDFRLSFAADEPDRLRFGLSLPATPEIFHLIPGCLFGDNNHEFVRPNEFPTLHREQPGNSAASPLWEFRADRASHPVSAVFSDGKLAAISIDPYSPASDQPDGFVRNGLWGALPASCGVSLGYGNFPSTFVNKGLFVPQTAHLERQLEAAGTIWLLAAADRRAVHPIIREIHQKLREPAHPRKSVLEAAHGLGRAFAEVNWSPAWQNYGNLRCQIPGQPVLETWRPLSEIGWTGGSMLAFPLLMAAEIDPTLQLPKDGIAIFDEIAAARNPASGFFFDTTGRALTRNGEEREFTSGGVNSWWSGFLPETRDRHCAYTNGQATTYLLKAAAWIEPSDPTRAATWRGAALGVLDTIVGLQREDGHLGYLYDTTKPAVADWDGFAGCWFVAGLALAWRITQDPRYLEAATRALDCYALSVRDLTCWGTPMDTWRSIDSEAAVAFLEGALQLYRATGAAVYLEHLRDGADYEFLWRYAFRARPEFEPLKGANWNSCGGVITSISNPHIHPMGLLIDSALLELAEATGDRYYSDRADEGLAWAMHTMELYPEHTGYGQYGVLTERFCPTDGLLTEVFSDTGLPSSIWWTYNGWAGACVLEACARRVLAKHPSRRPLW